MEINTKSVKKGISQFDEKANRLLEKFKKNHVGKKNSITAKQLYEWGTPRQIRCYIHHLRMRNEPICSGLQGYWYAEKKEDIEETIKFLLDPRIEIIIGTLKTTMRKKFEE